MAVHTVFPMMLIRTGGLPLVQMKRLSANWQTAEERIWVGRKQVADAHFSLQQAWDALLAALHHDSPLRTAVYNARKQFFQRQKQPAPALLQQLAGQTDIAEANTLLQALARYELAQQALDTTLLDHRQQVESALLRNFEVLQHIAANPNFQRALLFASHSLFKQLRPFGEKSVDKFGKKERQVALSVLQYATRMATKTSPLSRFTTVGWKKLDQLATKPAEHQEFDKTVVTPNVTLLEAIYTLLLTEPAFYRTLDLALNPCLVATGPEKYAWLYYDGAVESIQEAQASPLLDHLVEVLLENKRQLNYEKLLGHLTDNVEATAEALEAFIRDLADLGFLEWVLPENGLSPSWCSNLYQYLGFLSGTPLIVDTAALLHWLRTTARTFQYLAPEAVLEAQVAAAEQVRLFFEKYGQPEIRVPIESLFFEDATSEVTCSIPEEDLRVLLSQLADCWETRPPKTAPPDRAELANFIARHFTQHESIEFMAFCRQFMAGPPAATNADQAPAPNPAGELPQQASPNARVLGALIQPYRDKQGHWHAVVNHLFPGGGKLYARWLHLFPPTVQEALREWNFSSNQAPFSWQSWSNANFQPPLYPVQLHLPGGRRLAQAPVANVYLGNIHIAQSASGPCLWNADTGAPVVLTDLGLESPDSRPPAIQVVWRLGVPYVSVDALLPGDLWKPLYDEGIWYRARFEYRQLVLARAAWSVTPSVWKSWLMPDADWVDFFMRIREVLRALGVPALFFASFSGEKPQYYDQNSPVLMVLFQKSLERGSGTLFLTEMLPQPAGAIAEQEGARAAEFAVEWKLG